MHIWACVGTLACGRNYSADPPLLGLAVMLVPLLELSLTLCLEVNDHIDPQEPSRHASASSARVLLELRGSMWNECESG